MNLNYKKMKQTFIHILLGFFIATTIAAGTMAVTTVKPAKPKAVIIKQFESCREAVSYAKNAVSKGWIVKSFTTNDGSNSRWAPTVIILETY
jgi:hypothetical protein